MSIEAMKMALNALESLDMRGGLGLDVHEYIRTKIEALRQAIEQAQKKEWVGLTNEEIDDLWKTEYFNIHYELPRAIEAKLKEKNT